MSFWNNLHQVRSKLKYLKVNHLLGAGKPKGIKRIAKIDPGKGNIRENLKGKPKVDNPETQEILGTEKKQTKHTPQHTEN